MKTAFLPLLLLLFSFSITAQNNIRVGEANKGSINTTKREYIVDTKNNKLIAIKGHEDKFSIISYNLETLEETHRSKVISLIADDYREDFFKVHGQYYITYNNLRKKGFGTHIRRVDVEESLPKINRPLSDKKTVSNTLVYQQEIDGDLTVIEFSKEDDLPLSINYTTLGKELEETMKTSFQLSTKKKNTYVSSEQLDDEGNYYLLTGFLADRNKKEPWKRPTDYTLIKLNPNNNKQEVLGSITLEQEHLGPLFLHINKNGDIFLHSSYSNGEKKTFLFGKTKGFILAHYNPATKQFKTTTHDFSYEVVSQYKTEEERQELKALYKSRKLGILGLLCYNIESQKDGSTVFIFGTNGYKIRQAQGYATSTTHAFGEMIAVKIGADGQLVWEKQLPRRYIGIFGHRGFSYSHIDNKHWIFYGDHVDNRQLATNEIPALYEDKSGVLAAYEIDDQSGEVKKHHLFSLSQNTTGKQFFRFNTGGIVVLDNGKILFDVLEKRAGDRLIEIPHP